MRIALLQLNVLIGDVTGNARMIAEAYERALADGAELVVSTELGLTGYPPRDLLLSDGMLDRQSDALAELALRSGSVPLVVGFAERNATGRGKGLFNSVAVLERGRVMAVRRKTVLPTYDVFDEHRYFEPWTAPQDAVELCGRRVVLLICEDIWGGLEDRDCVDAAMPEPVAWAAAARPELAIVINGSPYWWGKGDVRRSVVAATARHLKCPVAFANQVGGNDELLFDGRSFAVRASGAVLTTGPPFREATVLVETSSVAAEEWIADTGDLGELESALVMGLRDYVGKTGAFPGGALIGVSGGLDSAVVARLAVEALGAARVSAVTMPSPFSTRAGLEDARRLAQNLQVELRELPITPVFECFSRSLRPQIGWCTPPSVVEENVQARIRAAMLMAVSNREGRIVLGTGNKSELAMGYCTLYGDMAAGLGVISDVPKTVVRRLAVHMNQADPLIPERILTKPPSPELRPGQQDTDTLPEYDRLDPLLEAHIERHMDANQLIAAGFDAALVLRVVRAVERAEFKRRQMAPGLKVTAKAFGVGRRMPIAAAASVPSQTR